MTATAPPAGLICKAVPSVVLKVDEEPGVVEALVSTTAALDAQNDVIVPGAYAKFIAAAKAGEIEMPAVCWAHDWDRPTGTTLDIEEWMPGDERLPAEHQKNGWGALWVKYRYVLDADDGRNAYALKKAGGIRQHSVGFMPDEDSAAEGKAIEWRDGRRHINRIFPLVEHSDVIMGAAPRTQALRVKSSDDDDHEARVADRLKQARELAAAFKADWSSSATTRSHEEGKAATEGERKADGDIPGVPALPDDEAAHYGPLLQALDGIKSLIAQECSEPGYSEFGDIITLCFVGQDLLRWVRGEASGYGEMADMYPIWDLFDAGREVLDRKRVAAEQSGTPIAADPPSDPSAILFGHLSEDDIRAALHSAATEAANSSTQHHVPDTSDERDGLSFERRRARPHPLRFGG